MRENTMAVLSPRPSLAGRGLEYGASSHISNSEDPPGPLFATRAPLNDPTGFDPMIDFCEFDVWKKSLIKRLSNRRDQLRLRPARIMSGITDLLVVRVAWAAVLACWRRRALPVLETQVRKREPRNWQV